MFGTTRPSILGKDSLPNVNQVYFNIVQEEKVQKMAKNEERGEVMAFAVKTVSNPNRSKLNCTVCNISGHDAIECFTSIAYPD